MILFGIDYWACGMMNVPLALYFGNLAGVELWFDSALDAWCTIGLPASMAYAKEGMTIWFFTGWLSVFVVLKQPERARALLGAIGLVWSKAGFECYSALSDANGSMMSSFNPQHDAVFMRLLIYLSSPPSPVIDEEAGAWIPTPAELAQHERDYTYARQVRRCMA